MKKTFIGIVIITFFIAIGTSFATNSNVNTYENEINAATALNSSEPEMISQNQYIEMSYNNSTNLIVILDKKTGEKWYSVPQDSSEDAIAQGSSKAELASQLVVQYYDSKNTVNIANSKTSCVARGTYKAFNSNNGLIIEYDFSREKEKFKIPVRYYLNNEYFCAEILFNNITEYGENKISEIKLLPFFASEKGGKEGFMFIPDGAGAIVDFGLDKKWASPYRKQIYGKDPAVSNYEFSNKEEIISLPVFGIKKEKSAMLAIIEKGDTNAYIEAVQPGRTSTFGSVCPSFIYRQIDTRKLYDKYNTEKVITYVSSAFKDINPIVRYKMLGENAKISDLATAYRSYLINEKGLKRLQPSEKTPITIETYGETKSKESFFGFIVDKVKVATSIDDTFTILKTLTNKAVSNIDLLMYYYNTDGTHSSVQSKYSVDYSLGSIKKLNGLIDYAKTSNSNVNLAVDNINISKESFGIWEFNSAATNLKKEKMFQYGFKQSLNIVDKKDKKTFYLKPNEYLKAMNSYIQSFKGSKVNGVLFQNTGSIIYSDYSGGSLSQRNKTADYYKSVYKTATDRGVRVIVDGANAYSLEYASQITNVPLQSTKFDIITQQVPFYQMALHGLVKLAGTPLNCSSDSENQFLLSVLTGTSLNYKLTGNDPILLKDTVLNNIFSSYYLSWAEEIAEKYKVFNDIHKNLQDKFIVDFEMKSGVSKVKYENGTVLLVNSNDFDSTYEGIALKAKEYKIID